MAKTNVVSLLMLMALLLCAVTSAGSKYINTDKDLASETDLDADDDASVPAGDEEDFDDDDFELDVLGTEDDDDELPEDDNYDVIAKLPEQWPVRNRRGFHIRKFIQHVAVNVVGRGVEDVVKNVIKKIRDRRDVTGNAENETDNTTMKTDLLLSQKEAEMYANKKNAQELLRSTVARVELVARPLHPTTPESVSKALEGKQHAVVATLYDGRRFMLVKGNRRGQGRRTVVIPHDHVTDDWKKQISVFPRRRVLGRLVFAGGDKFHPVKDNGRHAALRMITV